MTTLDQLRDQAKREALNYLTDCVFFALVKDKITETEAQIKKLAEQRSELKTVADQLYEEAASFQPEIKTPSPKDNLESRQQQLHQTQTSLAAIEDQISTLEGQDKTLQSQIAKFRNVTVPDPPRGLKKLGVS